MTTHKHELITHFYPAKTESKYSSPCFLIHGWGADSGTWLKVIPFLDKKYDCHAVDLPGFGMNSEIEIQSLDELLVALGSVLPDRAIVIGWSLGGMLATMLAHRYPERVNKLITLASNLKFVSSRDKEDPWNHAMPDATFAEFTSSFDKSAARTLKRFITLQVQGDSESRATTRFLKRLPGPASVQAEGMWARGLAYLDEIDNRLLLPDLTQPCLHIFGEQDELVPVDVVADIQAIAPSHSVKVFADHAHAMHISRPDTVVDIIDEFIVDSDFQRSKKHVARSFGNAASRYDSVASMQKAVAEKLLKGNQLSGPVLVDIGCGTGFCIEHLLSEANREFETVVGLDIAPGMLRVAKQKIPGKAVWLCSDMEALPFSNSSVNNFISSFSLQWSEKIALLMTEIFRTLRPGGSFLFSTLGPDTLFELHHAWQAVDSYVHVNAFTSREQVLDAVKEAGFEVACFDSEKRTLVYDDVFSLMRELKAIGAHNINTGQNKGLTGKRRIKSLQRAYDNFRTKEGLLPATYEIFYCRLTKPKRLIDIRIFR